MPRLARLQLACDWCRGSKKSENRSLISGVTAVFIQWATSNQSESITALRLLKWFLSAVCETVDRDGWLILRDPVLRAEVAIPARRW